MSEYSELKRRALDATPGPWYERDDEDSAAGAVFIMPESDVWMPPICRITVESNAAFIAAANPAAVLDLMAENEALRKALTTIRDESDDIGACECAADALIDSRK